MAIRGTLIAVFAAAVLIGAGPAAAEPIRIGVLTDLSSFGSDVTGKVRLSPRKWPRRFQRGNRGPEN